ncbi:hypothetical protein DYQ93_08505 [Xanthomonas sp. LMG 8992]|nr:hypothetical protein [Xanthomonas sp. LMG 8992]MXV11071.1 hypothetical protein [Xanthomonas sp. LMG 8992]
MLRIVTASLLALALIPAAHAAPDCSGDLLPKPLALPATVAAPVASELFSRNVQLGMPSGVLTQSYSSDQSLDRVLLRLRAEGCQSLANATPGAVKPNDPAAYKPATAFDNTPWRFDMSQNGKRMTAEEFDAWMKARGVRVVKARPAPAPAPAAAAEAPAPADANKQ